MDRIKRISNEVMNEYSERFGTDFATNKQSLNEISIVRSKGLKNKIAGYITKILQRKAKFDERKQMLIDNTDPTNDLLRQFYRVDKCNNISWPTKP